MRCNYCGLPTNTPNYAYHVCVMPIVPRRRIDALEARIKELEVALYKWTSFHMRGCKANVGQNCTCGRDAIRAELEAE